MQSGVFIERNGILNVVRQAHQQQVNPLSINDFHLNTQALEPLRRLKAAGLVLIVTTNQPGLSLGDLTRHELERMHQLLRAHFPLDAIYVCPHTEADRCYCRKPKTGLFLEAAHQWRLNLDHSFVISDKWQDAVAAHNVGCTSLLVSSPWNGTSHHDFILPTLEAVADRILALRAGHFVSEPLAADAPARLLKKYTPMWKEFGDHWNPLLVPDGSHTGQ